MRHDSIISIIRTLSLETNNVRMKNILRKTVKEMEELSLSELSPISKEWFEEVDSSLESDQILKVHAIIKYHQENPGVGLVQAKLVVEKYLSHYNFS